MYADDPQLLLGRANALIELNRSAEALPLLESLSAQSPPPARRTSPWPWAAPITPWAATEADTALRLGGRHLPGFEGMARYAVFLAQTGRKDEARETLAEIDKRLAKTHSHFRKEAGPFGDHHRAGSSMDYFTGAQWSRSERPSWRSSRAKARSAW
jgi:hypothetical protein